jgi:preprotein translocase subunit SecF
MIVGIIIGVACTVSFAVLCAVSLKLEHEESETRRQREAGERTKFFGERT